MKRGLASLLRTNFDLTSDESVGVTKLVVVVVAVAIAIADSVRRKTSRNILIPDLSG